MLHKQACFLPQPMKFLEIKNCYFLHIHYISDWHSATQIKPNKITYPVFFKSWASMIRPLLSGLIIEAQLARFNPAYGPYICSLAFWPTSAPQFKSYQTFVLPVAVVPTSSCWTAAGRLAPCMCSFYWGFTHNLCPPVGLCPLLLASYVALHVS